MKFHLHLLIEAEVNKPPQDEQLAKDWLDRLIVAIGMEKFGGPWAKYCDDPENRGLTAQAWLTTSHVAFHAWDGCDQPFMKFDVYSCRDFSVDTILELFEEFEPVAGAYTIINRTDTKAPPLITQGSIL